MSTGQFVDISQWNGAVDWQKYKAWSAALDGVSRVSMRSTYGAGYKDTKYDTYRAGATAAGMDVIIHYHYAYPQFNSALAEADWQAKVIGSIGPKDVIMLDYEENLSTSTAQWALDWLNRQAQNFPGHGVTIYASGNMISLRLQDNRLTKYPLTFARWTFSTIDRPPAPPPWVSYDYLQYTDKAIIPGITGIVDANLFIGANVITPPVVTYTVGQVASATDEWARTTVRPIPSMATGIGHAWLTRTYQGYRAGPPVDVEYTTVDFNNIARAVQLFQYARAEWDPINNVCRWFDARGEIL